MKEEIYVIIPALNEADSIQKVIEDIPMEVVTEVIVVDNGSSDQTFERAQMAGATVLLEERRGYGSACLKGISYLQTKAISPDIVVFLDADYSDYPGELSHVVEPIQRQDVDLVIGSRVLGNRERNSMTIPQVFGNWLATRLISWLFGQSFTDLGPFRAIKWQALESLGMKDPNYGWTVEMQVKAAKKRLTCKEVPVSYRKRIGKSKVSGTVKGTILAGYKILFTIAKNI